MIKTFALAALLAATALGTTASAASLILNGSFENDPAPGSAGINNGLLFGQLTTTGPGWDIYASVPGWTKTAGSGIEIQTDQAVGETDALFGEHYVELDSNNNSSMQQSLGLGAGKYKLSFWFSPRALPGGKTAETNGISYAIGSLSGNVTGPGAAPATSVGTWTEITGIFTVASAGTYALDFAAVGTSDSYGGFIDNVSVAAVPVPAAGLLLVGALGGLGALARRHKTA